MSEFLPQRDWTVIVGSGIAGLMAAMTLAPQPVLLVTRGALGGETSSAWAQGGIAASLGPDDRAALHVADTLAAGDGLCDEDLVVGIVSAAPAVIDALERAGVRFDRDAGGNYVFGLEAAHSRRRILHAEGDGSGAAIVRALADAVRRTPSITVLEGTEVRRLLTEDGVIAGLACAGPNGSFLLPASQVILATGGLGGLYDATTNPSGNFGQGIMLAARAGAILADMEFVQFHPTALSSPRRPLALVSEAVRGEGALLLNENGERFMAAVPGAELASRDIVARAIDREILRGGRVFLDARQALGSGFASRFPSIDLLCREAGIDPARELVPVRPAVHYHMGGVATDNKGRSSVRGLWVAGETACTGLHGANRLASNSLLEAAAMGMRAAQDIAGRPAPAARSAAAVSPNATADFSPADLAAVRPIVSRHLGIVRHAAGLAEAIRDLLPLAERNGPASDPAVVALSIAVFAALRRESRGAHFRDDFSQKDAKAMRRRLSLNDVVTVAHEFSSSSLATAGFARSA
ncbi:L-aspartate oxidase [Agrobacterium sp. ATCC 31749]|uniref:L-aspartate oxidase n=1 Tax=unclassified Agrobacterium TaxID=2632611 RepID=UPI00020DC048|nr:MULTISPECIES: L-aspartate oxidase [unclassified Agrobacterium]EGL63980.1 L-aspartate oxidase [Agrobacterium sp. ATCC 31749]QKW99194.1 L-aspartate oxidase [Agrobacterium sp. CGMCC 11546]